MIKNVLIPGLIILTLAAIIAGGVFLYSQTTGAQTLGAHGREAGEAGRVPAAGETLQGRGPFGGGQQGRGGHAASPLGALPEVLGHLFIVTLVIGVTLGLQKIVRRRQTLRSA